nr:isoform 2 of dual specificity protein phosphatase 1 [Quercus suber]
MSRPPGRYWEFAVLSDDFKKMGWVDHIPRTGNLYIGGLHALYQKPELFKQHNISHILSVLDYDIYENGQFSEYKHYMLRVDDDPNEDLLKHFHATNAFIDEALQGGGAVFVHCAMGKSRSATIVCAYLMWKHRITAKAALDQLCEGRPVCSPNPGFGEQLDVYFEMLQNEAKMNEIYDNWDKTRFRGNAWEWHKRQAGSPDSKSGNIADHIKVSGGGDQFNVQQTPNLAVDITTLFPDAEVFGVKLVNGRATRAVLDVTNNEAQPISLLLVGGSLTTPSDQPGAPDPPQILRNLTSTKYSLSIPAGQKESINYAFTTDMHPQTLRLNLAAMLQDSKGTVYTKPLFNETVSIVEAPVSIFDPQMYGPIPLSWYKKRGGKGGERAQRSSGGSKKVNPADQAAVIGADGPAVASGSTYDESWIPAGHLKRPEAKRVGSGRPKSRAT